MIYVTIKVKNGLPEIYATQIVIWISHIDDLQVHQGQITVIRRAIFHKLNIDEWLYYNTIRGNIGVDKVCTASIKYISN